ncbi:e3 ubiquitin-protein ligase RNF13 [Trichonephila clavipes]|nr:e3 ubiquitin-protein ligase RNF13 [Trichonephila clavipes]
MTPHTITPAMEAVRRCKAKAGLRRSARRLQTRTRLSSLPRLNLDSSIKTTWFLSVAVQFLVRGTTQNRGIDGWASRAAHVMGTAIPNVLPGAFVWFEKTQGPLMKVLPVPGWTADEAVGCTRAFLTMWWSSQRLVCRGLVFM